MRLLKLFKHVRTWVASGFIFVSVVSAPLHRLLWVGLFLFHLRVLLYIVVGRFIFVSFESAPPLIYPIFDLFDAMFIRHYRFVKSSFLSYSNMCSYHTMMTSSNGNIFRITRPLCGEFTCPGEFPAQRPVTRSFDVFFDLRLNKRLSKQSWDWWF